MSDEIFEQVFQMTGAARLEVSNIRGSVDIHPGADGIITVKATKQSSTGDASRTEIEMKQETDGSVKVKTHFPEAWFGWLIGSRPCKVDYAITAPRACVLHVNGVSNDAFAEGFNGDASFKTVSGELTLKSMNGPLNLNSVSGDVELTDLTGSLRLTTVSGDVRGGRIAGSVSLNTVSGDVEFDQSNLPAVDATTVSGELEFETALGTGPYKFNSVSGNLKLKVPADTRCSAELHSVSGGISTKLPTTSISRNNGAQTAEVQGGGVKVYLHSVSGDLELKS